jgi:hypothetical protein
VRGRIGRSQHHFSIVGQGDEGKEGEMLAIAWLTALREETEKVRGASCTLLYPFLVP